MTLRMGKEGLYYLWNDGGVTRATKITMPRIDDRILNSIFYLYPTVEEAKAGEEIGGTGFRVSVASEMHSDRAYLYAVSNAHVVNAPGYAPVIRWNSESHHIAMMGVGDQVIVPLACNQWTPHPDGDDLAITPLGSIVGPRYGEKFYRTSHSVPSFMFLTRKAMRALDIGPGDDVYMVGRFVHHAGKHFNQPSVRSGIISLMPTHIEMDPGVFQEAFLIEMRSIVGHSGSPVIWTYPNSDLFLESLVRRSQTSGSPPESFEAIHNLLNRQPTPDAGSMPMGPWLVGVDCADFKFYNDVVDSRQKKTGLQAKSHAGQSIVIPAWKLQELLDLEEFVMARKHDDEKAADAKRKHPVERNVAGDNSPFTQDAFEGALKKASQKVSQPSEPEPSDSQTSE